MKSVSESFLLLCRGFLLSGVLFLLSALPAVVYAGFSGASYGRLSPERQLFWKSLLHYSGDRSQINAGSDFFLSPEGYRDPGAEYEATVRIIEAASPQVCDYPARYYFITGREVPESCAEYQRYLDYVPWDEVFTVFATENAAAPISSMGHLMLMTRGLNRRGIPQHYGIGFVAPSDQGSFRLFRDFLTGSIEGRFILNPYDDVIYNYVSQENRSLWEYRLRMTPEERDWLRRHVFELRTHTIRYSFSSHNCASGVGSVLAAAGRQFQGPDNILYLTPLEYAEHLSRHGLIAEIGMRPSASDSRYLREGRVWNPLDRNSPFRISGGYLYRENGRGSRNHGLSGGFLELTPVISDLRDDSRGSPGTAESVFLRTRLEYLGRHLYVRSIDVASFRKIPDLFSGEKFGTSFGFSFRGDHDTLHTSLYPEISLGGSSGFEYGIFSVYGELSGRGAVFGSPEAALGLEAGIFLREPALGRIRFFCNDYLASSGEWFGTRRRIAVSWSRIIVPDFNAGFGFSRDFRKRGRPLNEISGFLTYFF